MSWLRRDAPAEAALDPSARAGAGAAARERLQSWAAPALAIVLTIVAGGLAWGGQALTTRKLPESLSALDLLQGWFGVYFNRREISAAFILLCAGGLILGAVSAWRDATPKAEPLLRPVRALRFAAALDAIVLMASAVGIALWALFLWVLYDDRYTHWLNIVLALAIALMLLPLARHDLEGRRPRIRWSWWVVAHVAFAAVIAGAFIYLNARDLRSWKYAAVGDEYNSYNYALAIMKGGAFNPWSHRGADQLAAVLGSASQALVMKLGDGDNFAWKLWDIVVTALALIPFYFLIRELFHTRLAVLATIFFASSHYLFGYAHHGLYLDGLLPTMLGLWLLVLGLKHDSTVALFVAGLALGIGFYTFESGRAAVIVVAAWMLTFGWRVFRPSVFVPLAAGFIILALPLFAADGPRHVIDQMFGQSAVKYSSTITGDRIERFKTNVQFSVVSFNYSNAGRHYVWGSLADPVTAALFVLGLGVAAFRIKQAAYRLLVIWYVIELGFGGFSNPYPMPPISRLQAVVPPLAALAAVGVEALLAPFAWRSPARALIDDRRWQFGLGAVAVGALAPLVLYLNLYRFWYEMPHKFGEPTNETAVVRAYQEHCEGRPTTIIAKDPLALLQKVFASYHATPEPVYVYYPAAAGAIGNPAAKDFGDPECVIVQPGAPEPAQQQAVLDGIPKRWPQFQGTTVTDISKQRQAYLFTAPGQ
ncbi:MAG TPA: glycosyltransferase family 39 protein [Dehalococcoidia bacterium]|nr:glycosyltransferase family 39 protein [Dehalococcoidia bacterium]